MSTSGGVARMKGRSTNDTPRVSVDGQFIDGDDNDGSSYGISKTQPAISNNLQ